MRADDESEKTDEALNSINIDQAVNSENTTDKAVNSENTTDKAVNSENTTDKAVNSKNTTDKAVNSKNTTDKTVNSENTTDNTVNSKKTTDIAVNSENTTDKAVNSENTTDKAVNADITDQAFNLNSENKQRRKKYKSNSTLNTSEDAHKAKLPNISYSTLFNYASFWDKVKIFIAITISICAAFLYPYAITVVADIFQSMIDYEKSVQKGARQDKKFSEARDMFSLKYTCIGVVFFLGGYVGTSLMNLAAVDQVFRIRKAYLRAALHQDLQYFDEAETKDFASRMADDIFKVEKGIGHNLSALVYNLVLGITCLLLAFIKGWKLTLVCLGPLVVSSLLLEGMGLFIQRLAKKEALINGKAAALAEEVLSSIRTVYSFNGQKTEIARYSRYMANARKSHIIKEGATGVSMGVLYCSIYVSYALSFYYGVQFILNEPQNYNAHVMFAVLFGLLSSSGFLGNVGLLAVTMMEARGAGAQIFKLLKIEPKINPFVDRGLRPNFIFGNVELKNVVFHYPARPGITVLKGLSLTVKAGQSVALVGYSGSGKSTVIQLISRFYDVSEGNVYLDGADIRTLSVRWLRMQIGLVGQEPVLFNTTLRDNIRYGYEAATNEDIEEAAKQANAHEFIVKLPKGYDTLVGEGGTSLSGGQKQRVAIARALVRNPRLLLLDEATSALDTASESLVQQALATASQGRTTITVAHRLSTIRNSDVIYVINEGELQESGTHNELVNLKGHYYDMMQMADEAPPDALDLDEKISLRDLEASISRMSQKSLMPVESEKKITTESFVKVIGLNKPEWRSITLGTITSVLIGFSTPMFLIMFGDLFGTLSSIDVNYLQSRVNTISVISLAIGGSLAFLGFTQYMAFGIAGGYLTERLRLRMFEHLLHQPISYYDEPTNSTGALCARLSLEATYIRQALGQRIALLLESIGMVCLSIVTALYFEWRIALVASCFSPFLIIVIYFQSIAARRESVGHSHSLEKSTKIAMDAITNIRTVVSLGREEKFLEEYEKQLKPAIGPAKASAHLLGVATGLYRSIFQFMNATSMYYGGSLILNEGLPYKCVLIATQAYQLASQQVQNTFTYVPDFQKGITAANRVMTFLKLRSTLKDPEYPSIVDFQASGEASFNRVRFSYPNRPSVLVLRELNLEIPKGKTIAVVGESGSGKSTIVKLLERFYDPTFGSVRLDGIPLTSLLMADVRRSYGLVSQEPVLFDRSIRDNIAYGDTPRPYTQSEIEEAAEQANIHDFIKTLPEGYDSHIGSKGVQLSGGQKQRLAIARALVRHPPILLLDEATSALDSQSEQAVQKALDRAKEGRTCVTIAHRLSTVRDADVICVVKSGRVTEAGTHQELMDKKGAYYKLHHISFSAPRASTAPTDASTE